MYKALTFVFLFFVLTTLYGQEDKVVAFSKELNQVAFQTGISCDSLVHLREEGIINKRKEGGSKNGYWVHFVQDSLGQELNTCRRKSEGNYLNGRKEGKWIQYDNDGVSPKSIAPYKGGRLAGDTILTFTVDSIKLKSIYSSGIGNGSTLPSVFIIFYGNGCIDKKTTTDSIYHYANDCSSADGKGTLLYKYPNMHGKVRMKSRCSFKNDTVTKPDYYSYVKNHLPFKNYSGYIKVFDPNHGQLIIEGDVIEGVLDNGFIYVYDEDNLLIQIKKVIKGKDTFYCNG